MDDREQAIAAAKQRMAAFRLRQSPPANNSTSTAPPAKLHARSHSCSNSILNFPLSTSAMTNATPADEPQETPGPVPSSPSPRSSRPNSHHRRRSSVSTRRESAEMMGVAPPPESTADVAGDQSELRRLALWTLEGKSRSDNAFIGGFTKVEIPELDTPEADANLDALQASKHKPLSAFGMSNSLALAGKRDSFGKLLMSTSNSLKDQLHTLMEEEEEEEEEEKEPTATSSEAVHSFRAESPFRDEAPFTRPPALQPNRHRPTNLTLRPLSLTPESLPLSRSEAALPTPSPTPSPRIGGLKSLTLAPSPSVSPVPSHTSASSVSSAPSRRQSLSVSPSPQPAEYARRRQSLGTAPSSTPEAPKRKSSISYKQANSSEHPSSYLPTPGPTPTSPMPPMHARLPSSSSSSHSLALAPELERSLSPTEQAFLFRSHTSLLCRISDLEKAITGGRGRLPPGAGVGLDAGPGFGMDELRDRSRSNERPSSMMSMSAASESDSVASISSQPSDEMLQLVSDLKAERDELMRDADGWRTRTADLEKQIGMLTRRVEAERREGWVVRERLGLLEVEKKRVREDAERARLECLRLEKAVRGEEDVKLKVEEERDAQRMILKEERTKREIAEREVERLRREVEQLCTRADQADADLQALLATPKVDVQMQMQMPVPRRFSSASSGTSSSSATDVEEYVHVGLRTLKLNVVEEEDEERDLPRDVTSEGESGSESDNDELAHYEDDEDLDDEVIFGDDQTSSSFGSIARSNSHLLRLDLAAVTPTPAPESAPTISLSHTKTGSMEKGWSFPHGAAQPSFVKDVPKIDHFFECLDALDENDLDEVGVLPTYDSATAKQFWRGAIHDDEDDDEMPPFVLPAQPSPPRKGKEWKAVEGAKLEVVDEEEEEEVVPFKFPTFPPFPEEESDLDGVDGFNAGPMTPRPTASVRLPVPAGTPTKHPKVRKSSIDLTIPGFKPYSGSVPILKAPPPPRGVNSPAKVQPTTPTARSTPESAAKQASPTLIPQPSQSPPSSSSLITPPKQRSAVAGPTFIPRLSTSPKPTPATTMTRTPPNPTNIPFPTMKLTPPSKNLTTSTPVFVAQPKMTNKPVTRSSPIPHPPPVLTRLSILQQTATPVSPTASPPSQGLTAKLSQQMQSLTSFWSPWSPSPSMAGKAAVLSGKDTEPEQRRARGYVSKERQLERLRLRLQREGVLVESCEQCANCRGGVIII